MKVEGGLAPLEMSVLAADGLVLRGTLAYPARAAGPFPLAVLAHQYPATRDSLAPLVTVQARKFERAIQRGRGPSRLASGNPDIARGRP